MIVEHNLSPGHLPNSIFLCATLKTLAVFEMMHYTHHVSTFEYLDYLLLTEHLKELRCPVKSYLDILRAWLLFNVNFCVEKLDMLSIYLMLPFIFLHFHGY